MPQLSNIVRRNGTTQRGKGCRGLKTRQTRSGSRGYAANDFLKQFFFPLIDEKLADTRHIQSAEKHFFDSTAFLCNAYNIVQPPLFNSPFPMNIAATYEALKAKIERMDNQTHLFISGTKQQPLLGTARTLSTAYNLYYIPLYPLATLLNERKTKALGNLILSACSRLYDYGVALCDSNSFIYYEMEMITDNLRDNAGDGDRDEFEAEIRTAEWIISSTATLSRCIAQKRNNRSLYRRLARITPGNAWERNVIAVIEKINNLKEKYPGRHFHQQIFPEWNLNRNDESIRPDQYLGFFWGGNSFFDDNLYEWVEASLQESTITVQPTFFQIFDREQNLIADPFAFESEMLELITEFIHLLYEYRRC